MTDWPFGDLKRGHYGAVYCDPPWHFTRYSEKQSPLSRGRAPQDHYCTMSDAEIAALPVADLAAQNCVLFMWAVFPKLHIAIETVKAWGFTFKTVAFSWIKADVSTVDMFSAPKDADILMGYWTRANGEICLLATRGSPSRQHADVPQGIIEPRREHSRKPDCVVPRIERLVAGPYCELFARQKRNGWDTWGNETDKFKAVV